MKSRSNWIIESFSLNEKDMVFVVEWKLKCCLRMKGRRFGK